MPKSSLIIGIAVLLTIVIGGTFVIDSAGPPASSSDTRTTSQVTSLSSESASAHTTRTNSPKTIYSTSTTTTETTAMSSTGQPVIIVAATALSSSIGATGGNNVTVSCQRPTATQGYGTITISNQGTGAGVLKILVIQYPGLSSFATASMAGRSCSVLPPNSSTTLYVTGLPVAAQTGSYYDGWFVLTSGAQTNVFSGQFA